jgi:hypothetical protein
MKPVVRTTPASGSGWAPGDNARRMMNTLAVLPKLASQIGFAVAAHPGAAIEVLPGSPTTITFTVDGELKGLMVLPIDEDEARMQLGLPTLTTADLAADTLFEEERQGDMIPPDEQLAAFLDHPWDL